MKADDQNVAIALACGWVRPYPELPNCWRHPTGEDWSGPFRHTEGKKRWLKVYPDFCNDLNACHKMEKHVVTAGGTWFGYISALEEASEIDGTSMIWHATAAQRCEAFLKCCGLWKVE